MLKRLYIDNFRCFVNFEIVFQNTELLLGGNGAGKSSVFAVIRKIQDFVLYHAQVVEMFTTKELTRWQTFELDLVHDTDFYNYRLSDK